MNGEWPCPSEDVVQAAVRLYAGALHKYVAERIPSSLRMLIVSDDVVQDTWLAACRSLHQFEPRGPHALEHWLRRIAHNELLHYARSARALKHGGGRRRTDLEQYARPAGRLVVGGLSYERTPSADVHAHEIADLMPKLVLRLPAGQREAVELYYLAEYSLDEVARQLGCSPAAAHSLIYRGVKKLRDLAGPESKYFSDAGSDASDESKVNRLVSESRSALRGDPSDRSEQRRGEGRAPGFRLGRLSAEGSPRANATALEANGNNAGGAETVA